MSGTKAAPAGAIKSLEEVVRKGRVACEMLCEMDANELSILEYVFSFTCQCLPTHTTHFAVVPMGPVLPGSWTWDATLRTSSHTWSTCRTSNLSRKKVLCLLSFFLRL